MNTKRPKLFYANPWDIVMDACLQVLQTRDPRFVGATFYSSMAARLVRDTGATQRDIHQGLRDFPVCRHPGPSKNLSAAIALITVNWKQLGTNHDSAQILRHFGRTAS